jgi:hypothetical protein
MNKFLIGSGYYPFRGSEWFYDLWHRNTPYPTIVLGSGGQPSPSTCAGVQWIRLNGDLGHYHDLRDGLKSWKFCDWSISIATLALLAYQSECDFIYKEQDCLAFGPWVEQLYNDAGNYGVIVGKSNYAVASQSLFMVKHWYIPEFVHLWLGTGPDKHMNGEHKFARLEAEHSEYWGRYKFGVDRDRPFDVKAPVWYAQKFTPAELREMAAAGLVSIDGMPEVQVFSGRPR